MRRPGGCWGPEGPSPRCGGGFQPRWWPCEVSEHRGVSWSWGTPKQAAPRARLCPCALTGPPGWILWGRAQLCPQPHPARCPQPQPRARSLCRRTEPPRPAPAPWGDGVVTARGGTQGHPPPCCSQCWGHGAAVLHRGAGRAQPGDAATLALPLHPHPIPIPTPPHPHPRSHPIPSPGSLPPSTAPS